MFFIRVRYLYGGEKKVDTPVLNLKNKSQAIF